MPPSPQWDLEELAKYLRDNPDVYNDLRCAVEPSVQDDASIHQHQYIATTAATVDDHLDEPSDKLTLPGRRTPLRSAVSGALAGDDDNASSPCSRASDSPTMDEDENPFSIPLTGPEDLDERHLCCIPLRVVDSTRLPIELSNSPDSGPPESITPITYSLWKKGFDLRLGERGRNDLKHEISRRTQNNADLKKSCQDVARLKRANIWQLFQLAEICGILHKAIRICRKYWLEAGRRAKTPRRGKSTTPRKSARFDIRTASPHDAEEADTSPSVSEPPASDPARLRDCDPSKNDGSPEAPDSMLSEHDREQNDQEVDEAVHLEENRTLEENPTHDSESSRRE